MASLQSFLILYSEWLFRGLSKLQMLNPQKLPDTQAGGPQKNGGILQAGGNQDTVHPHPVLQTVLDLPQYLREIGGEGAVDHDHIRVKGIEKVVDSVGHVSDKVVKKGQGIVVLLVAGGYEGVDVRMIQAL